MSPSPCTTCALSLQTKYRRCSNVPQLTMSLYLLLRENLCNSTQMSQGYCAETMAPSLLNTGLANIPSPTSRFNRRRFCHGQPKDHFVQPTITT